MLKVLEFNQKRIALSDRWDVALAKFTGMLSASEQQYRSDAEALLREADSAMSAVRAAGWRYFSTGEVEQKQRIVRENKLLIACTKRLRDLSGEKPLTDAAANLDQAAEEYIAATDQAIEADSSKDEISRTRTIPIANEVAGLLDGAVPIALQAVAAAKGTVSNEMRTSAQLSLGFGLVIIAVLIGTSVFSFARVARPLTRLNGAMANMAEGDLDIVIPGAHRGDELGDMAKTIAVIRDNAERKAQDETAAKIRQDSIAAELRKAEMCKLADSFESAVGEIIDMVSSAATKLEASANTLATTAEASESLATTVAAASETASTNVQSVASATEQMSSSVNEISRQVQESARIANEAVDQARRTNDRVSALSKAASRIGDVVELIDTIAAQTNLLALNATIEAARAGEAGRGFAVVASEVKVLAEQTGKATGEIGQQISGIQAATQESVGAIREISGTIEKLSEISSTIAAAVEQQGAATQEISRNVQQAAQGTQQVSVNITDVQRGAGETGSASSQVLAAAKSLSGDCNRLKLEVGRFLRSVRAG